MADDEAPKRSDPPVVTFQHTGDPEWVMVLVEPFKGAYVPLRLGVWKPIPNTEASIRSASLSVVRSRGAWLN